MVNGVLYITTPGSRLGGRRAHGPRALALRVEVERRHPHRQPRVAAIYGDWLYFETPDCHLVSLNIKDGTERWHQKICDLDQFYYGSVAPIIVKNHVIAGVSGDDLDFPGYIAVARLPSDGALQWRWYVVPQKMGEPGSETWPNEDAMKHGGGMTWQPVTYDPELNLIYVTTGNPQPVIAHKNRAGDNLYTGSIVALNADTGKMAWYFQSSPHDTHDWDSTQTPVLFDGDINGQPRKLHRAGRAQRPLLRARSHERQGDRLEGIRQDELGEGLRREGPADSESGEGAADRRRARVARSGRRDQLAAAELQPADRALLRQRRARVQRLLHLRSRRQPEGWGGTDRGGYSESMIQAIDYKTGKIKWSHKWETNIRSGLAEHGRQPAVRRRPVERPRRAQRDDRRRAVARAPRTPRVSNGPITYELDGLQYLIVGAGDTLWTFAMLHEHK